MKIRIQIQFRHGKNLKKISKKKSASFKLIHIKALNPIEIIKKGLNYMKQLKIKYDICPKMVMEMDPAKRWQ